jgi:hypothetical protein
VYNEAWDGPRDRYDYAMQRPQREHEARMREDARIAAEKKRQEDEKRRIEEEKWQKENPWSFTWNYAKAWGEQYFKKSPVRTTPRSPRRNSPRKSPSKRRSVSAPNCARMLQNANIHDLRDFRAWSLRNHPDKGGNTSVFQKVSNCVNEVFKMNA